MDIWDSAHTLYIGQLIPPYMPLQQQSTKKSQSLEKRIKKKKEKEGCKQQ